MSDIARRIAFALIFVLYVPVSAAGSGLVANCGDGPTNGTRIQYSEDDDGQVQILQEQLTLEPLIYAFDNPQPGSVLISYGGEEMTGTIVNTSENYKTVAYVYNEVAYMDTLFLDAGIVLSSEHKDGLFGESVVITWKIDCDIEWNP